MTYNKNIKINIGYIKIKDAIKSLFLSMSLSLFAIYKTTNIPIAI